MPDGGYEVAWPSPPTRVRTHLDSDRATQQRSSAFECIEPTPPNHYRPHQGSPDRPTPTDLVKTIRTIRNHGVGCDKAWLGLRGCPDKVSRRSVPEQAALMDGALEVRDQRIAITFSDLLAGH